MITGEQGIKIGVLGLGYVGLPLAAAFAARYDVVGFDINEARVKELTAGFDRTREMDQAGLAAAKRLTYSTDQASLSDVNVYIITTPTPIDDHKNPDMTAILGATSMVADTIRRGDVVIYESTVYPGATEEECVPLLEARTGMVLNKDFFVGYSPERINPGDREHRFESIVKVTSGSTPAAAAFIDDLYGSVVTAGTHSAPSIKVAEAAKVIENTQRDVNIALINELAKVFNLLGIDTDEVLRAAGTKWNFLNFRPGLVGGHCIGVDPYYLTHKAQSVGYHPEIMLAGRRLNDGMGQYVATELVKAMVRSGLELVGARVLIMGLTFKENTPDLRNTKVLDVWRELRTFNIDVDIHDPWADPAEARDEYGIDLVESPGSGSYDAIIIAVAHDEFCMMSSREIRNYGKSNGHVLFDLKHMLPKHESDLRL